MTIANRRNALKGLLAATLLPLIPGCSSAPGRPDAIAQGDFSKVTSYLQALVTHQMREQNITGLSIALVNDQQLTWTQGFGWADHAAGIPANSQTVYRVGSITKLFTVAAALQFAERGQLELDAPIQRVLPEFRIGSRFEQAIITPRMLMTHHAGLPRDLLRGMWGCTDGGFQEVLDYLANSELCYEPGEVESYSNIGLSVLGAAIERLAGRPFAEHMQDAMLAPLGMETASISCALPDSPFLSKAYDEGKESPEPGLRDIAAGGLNASVRDMSRFLMMIFGQGRSTSQRVLQENTVSEMFRVQNDSVALDFDLKMGLGWMLAPLDGQALRGGELMASHNGATINHRSLLAALPQHRIGVVILSNSANVDMGSLEALARKTLALALEAKTGIRQPGETETAPWREASLPTAVRNDYVGEYVTPAGLVRISLENQQLKAQSHGFRFDLTADDEGFLHLQKKILGLISLPLGNLEQMSFRLASVAEKNILVAQRGQTRMLFGERIANTPISATWHESLGIYLPELVGDDFMLFEKIVLFESEGSLSLRLSLRAPLGKGPSGTLLIQTLSDTRGILSEKLNNRGEMIRLVTQGNDKIVEISGYRFKRSAA